MSESWAIIGGGMLGLTMALRLAKNGHKVSVYEASPRLGGLADAWQVGGFTWDRHYHVILPVDRSLIALLDEIGLREEIEWRRTGTDLFDGSRFHPLNGAVDFLRLPILSLADKIRLAGTILYASRIRDGARLDTVGVEEWLTKLSGRKVFDTIWRPLLRAKLGEAYRETSASFIWAIARRLYSARAAGVARDRFGAVRGGYATVLAALARRLRELGVEMHVNTPVNALRRTANGHIFIAGGKPARADKVVVTTPPPLTADLCAELGEDEHARLRSVRYQGVICASAVLTRPLRGAYMTYITDPDCPLTTVIDMTAVAGRDTFGGNTLAYLPMYLPPADPLFDASDEEIAELSLAGLRRLYPDLQAGDVAAVRVSRARHVLPVPLTAHNGARPSILTTVPGLYTVNSANIDNGTLNVNETIDLADRALDLIGGDTTAQPASDIREAAA